MDNMAPSGPRTNARKRAAAAYQLRCANRTWEDIAEATGYTSPAAAHKAVKRHIQRMPAEDQQMARALSAGTHRLVVGELIAIGAAAKDANRLTTAAEAFEKASNVQDRHDKLIGLHVNVPQQVNVTVASPAEAIRAAREAMLEQLRRNPVQPQLPASTPDVIDAEVIDDGRE